MFVATGLYSAEPLDIANLPSDQFMHCASHEKHLDLKRDGPEALALLVEAVCLQHDGR